jgi:hypothetical protein
MDGIITFDNVDDLIYKLNRLDEDYYNSKIDAIEENYNRALEYLNVQPRIIDTITNVFKHNNLI